MDLGSVRQVLQPSMTTSVRDIGIEISESREEGSPSRAGAPSTEVEEPSSPMSSIAARFRNRTKEERQRYNSQIQRENAALRSNHLEKRLKSMAVFELQSSPRQQELLYNVEDHHHHHHHHEAPPRRATPSSPETGDRQAPPPNIYNMRLRDLYKYVQEKIAKIPSGPLSDGIASQKPRESLGGSGEAAAVLGGYLHPRDMRRMVTPFSTSNEPALIVRRHVMLLNFDPLRAIVLRDRLLLLVPDGADSIITSLEKAVRGGITGGLSDMENQMFGDSNDDHESSENFSPTYDGLADDEAAAGGGADLPPLGGGSDSEVNSSNDDRAARSFFNADGLSPPSGSARRPPSGAASPDDAESDSDSEGEQANSEERDVPFELICVDAVLQAAWKILSEDFSALYVAVHDEMNKLRGAKGQDVMSRSQEALRIKKNEISILEGRVSGFIRALNVVLDDDEDLALVNLSKLIRHPKRFVLPVSREQLEEDGDEPELILEAIAQQGLAIANKILILRANVTTTEELVSMKLDMIRNRLLAYNTIISLIAVCIGGAALVGGYFGMNVPNGFENDHRAFYRISLWTFVGTASIIISFSWILARRGFM